MRSSKDILASEYEDLRDAEYVESLTSKQLKQFKSSFRLPKQKKKVTKRKEKLNLM